jgi:hypothetical protein
MIFKQDEQLQLTAAELQSITDYVSVLHEVGLLDTIQQLTKRQKNFLCAYAIDKLFKELCDGDKRINDLQDTD